ncbi:Eco57I restriction-modification methylase domain-containing protein [Streptomyces lavendulae]|uniref:Eco57I restriction-modification methylase domain-containing protein n=1 Tax=Streptomyces lavendulae TaxID=1914 RepID=UPI00368CD8A0
MTQNALFLADSLPSIPDTAVEHGEVFTRDWVVEMILDLVGYTSDQNLAELVISDPACGSGAFLLGIARRLSAACRKHEVELPIDGVRALDLLSRNVRVSREAVADLLVNEGWSRDYVEPLVEGWVRQGDYLLQQPKAADFVVGNPPYIRLEDVPDSRMKMYRRNHPTMVGRADIYVGFYERALGALTENGALGFICADRWMRNQYGRELRRLVGEQFSVEFVAIMHDVDAFEESVSAYPAITVIRKRPQTPVVVAQTTKHFDAAQAQRLVGWTAGNSHAETTAGYEASRLPNWFAGSESWPAGSPARLEMLEDLNERFPALEDTGARVSIGLASGADAVFLTQDPDQVEQSRTLPMSMVRDARTGTLKWDGTYLVNPWEADGRLVDLANYPKLKAYFERNREALARRYIAKKNSDHWYKTIDKVDSSLTAKPKLLLPDMKLTIHPVLDEGGYYPHHNLYYVVADAWDLRVLGGLLLSRVAQAFVEAYAVRMRGGTLRFQAQYLRRIRVPRPETISETDAQALIRAFDARDIEAATAAALRVYGLGRLPS